MLRGALVGEGLPDDAVQLLPSADRASVTHLIQARGLVDVVIPRGGAGLIDAVVRDATVPTIETGVGNCHVYVHAAADLDVAERNLLNAKTRRPSVCNAAETLLIDAAIADAAVPAAGRTRCRTPGVTVHVTTRARTSCAPSSCRWTSRWPSSTVSTPRSSTSTSYGTGHTEAIVTTNLAAAATVHRAGRRRRGDGQRVHRASPTASSSASAPRSASPPRSCTPAARWACPN